MQSLSDLNNFGAQTIDVTDDRDTQIIFTGDAGDAEYTTYEGIPIYIKDALGVEIEDIVDYANLGMEVEIELLAPFPDGIELLFTNKPDYITITEVGATATITGFRSIADWLWLKNKVYFNKDVDWFGTFEYTVTVHNNISSPDRTFTATITVLELRYFDAPADYNYPYASTGYTAYPDWIIDGLDATTDGNYEVQIQAVGDHSANLAGARSTSSAGTYSYNDANLTLTLNANNKANIESMIAGVEFDFDSKQYPMEFEIFVQDQTFNSFAGDYEIQTVFSNDATILSDGTALTHNNTTFTIDTDSPLFNASLTGSGNLVADISAFDPDTVTDINGPIIPLTDYGLTTIYTETASRTIPGYISTNDLGNRVFVYWELGETPDTYIYRIYDWDDNFTLSYTFTPTSGYVVEKTWLSKDGDTLLAVEVNSILTPTIWKLRTAKWNGSSWDTYTKTFSSDFILDFVNDDATLIGNISQLAGDMYEWNDATNDWDTITKTGTKFASLDLDYSPQGNSNDRMAANGTVYYSVNTSSQVIEVFRWNGSSWDTYLLPGSVPSTNTPRVGISEDGNKIVAYWPHDTDELTSTYAWHFENGSYTSYLVDTIYEPANTSETVYTAYNLSIEPIIDNNGDVYMFLTDWNNQSGTSLAELYNFNEGYNADESLELQDAYPTGPRMAVAYDGVIIHRVERDSLSSGGPDYNVYIGTEKQGSKINTFDKRIVITSESLSNMNTFLQDVEIVPNGTDDIVLVYKVTAPDGSTTEKIYTIGYA